MKVKIMRSMGKLPDERWVRMRMRGLAWSEGPMSSRRLVREQGTHQRVMSCVVARITCVKQGEIVVARHCEKCRDTLCRSHACRCWSTDLSAGRICVRESRMLWMRWRETSCCRETECNRESVQRNDFITRRRQR